MISTILSYELKVAILLASFYMFYRLLLSKETFHKVNRCILLFTAVASFVLPFCVITITEVSTMKVGVGPLLMAHFENGGIVELVEETSTQDWWQFALLIIMILGAVIVGAKTVWSIVSVSRIIKKGVRKFLPDGTEIIISDKAKHGPFSWMRFIVLSEDDLKEPYKSIILHEQGHIAYGHSWDIIITDLLTSIQWFNPAIWMLRADLRALHEYQADDYALRGGINVKEYQLLLIKKAISMSGYSVANGFNHSILKNRITMMLSKKSSVRGLVKSLYLIPAVGISLTAFAETKTIYVSADKDVTGIVTEDEITDNLLNMQDQDTDDTVPQFPGGPSAMAKFVAENIRYPQSESVTAIINVNFDVDVDGTVKQVRVVNPFKKAFDEEAVRVIKSMPKWTAAKGDLQRSLELSVSILFSKSEGSRLVENKINQSEYTRYIDGEKVFIVAEVMPQYPGGDEALRHFLASEVKYPESAIKKGIQGRVFVTFIVDKNGDVRDAKIARGIYKALDDEALRVVKSMPKWSPGSQRGSSVAVSYTVPINFVLDNEKSSDAPKTNESFSAAVQQMPQYPGGETELYKFIAQQIRYPKSAADKGVQGKVFVQFIVDKDGKVKDAQIAKGVQEDLDKEALRVVNAMPSWMPSKPAMEVNFTLPVLFNLENGTLANDVDKQNDNSVALNRVVVVASN
ncbi:MAG: M56 family metallopeptidase [Bacteroidales bacterium]|nr:M56 family metallopeptidase [Bacteroidales bacterium]